MEVITIPNEFVSLFALIHGVAEVRREDGTFLGNFAPDKSKWVETAKELFDLEALEALARTNPPGKPLAEIMQKLQAMENR